MAFNASFLAKGKLVTTEYLAEFLAGDLAKYGVATVPLGENGVIIRYDMPGEDRGHSLKIRVGGVYQALPPTNIRHLLFTYTLLTEQFDQPGSVEEMDLLDLEIATVGVATVPGCRGHRRRLSGVHGDSDPATERSVVVVAQYVADSCRENSLSPGDSP